MSDELPEGPSKLVVGGLIGAAMLVGIFILVGWKWGLFCAALLAYEVWTFFNRYGNDTISETIWAMEKRPIVPFLFGVGIGWAISSGFVPATPAGVWVAFFLGFLYGHFFFQRQGD